MLRTGTLRASAEPGALSLGGQRLVYAGAARGPVTVILRSSDLALAPGSARGAALSGVLEESLFLGPYYRHNVRVGDAVLMVDGAAPAPPGPVDISVPPEHTRVFPAA